MFILLSDAKVPDGVILQLGKPNCLAWSSDKDIRCRSRQIFGASKNFYPNYRKKTTAFHWAQGTSSTTFAQTSSKLKFILTFPKTAKLEHDLQKNVLTFILGAFL